MIIVEISDINIVVLVERKRERERERARNLKSSAGVRVAIFSIETRQDSYRQREQPAIGSCRYARESRNDGQHGSNRNERGESAPVLLPSRLFGFSAPRKSHLKLAGVDASNPVVVNVRARHILCIRYESFESSGSRGAEKAEFPEMMTIYSSDLRYLTYNRYTNVTRTNGKFPSREIERLLSKS